MLDLNDDVERSGGAGCQEAAGSVRAASHTQRHGHSSVTYIKKSFARISMTGRLDTLQLIRCSHAS
jgi:hypothetical protein